MVLKREKEDLLFLLKEKLYENAVLDAMILENSDFKETALINVRGLDFFACPNVFSPKIFNSSEFFLDNILKYKGNSFLEIGSGTGIISVFAALQGTKRVVSTDINPYAVENTFRNAAIHGVSSKFTTLQGDVFKPVGKETFDLLFWYAPFAYVKNDFFSLIKRSIYDLDYQGVESYLRDGKQFLSPQGKMLLGFSSSHGHIEVIEDLAKKYSWEIKIIDQTRDYLYCGEISIELYELTPMGNQSQ